MTGWGFFRITKFSWRAWLLTVVANMLVLALYFGAAAAGWASVSGLLS